MVNLFNVLFWTLDPLFKNWKQLSRVSSLPSNSLFIIPIRPISPSELCQKSIAIRVFVRCFNVFGCARSQMQHTGSFIEACKLLVAACGIQFPALEVWNLSHWTTSKVPQSEFWMAFLTIAKIKLSLLSFIGGDLNLESQTSDIPISCL